MRSPEPPRPVLTYTKGQCSSSHARLVRSGDCGQG